MCMYIYNLSQVHMYVNVIAKYLYVQILFSSHLP